MGTFIWRKDVFHPKLIIVYKEDQHSETSNRMKLPRLKNFLKKSELFEYDLLENKIPLTDPVEIAAKLEDEFLKSKFNNDSV